MSQQAAVVTKEPWGDMLKRIFFNGTAPLTDDGGTKIVGLAIKAGQEVVYSKVIRKFMRADNKSWMNLTIFSLLTAAFDDGLGAWYGDHKPAGQQGFGDVAMELPRPLLSCIAINYIMNSTALGFHNPMSVWLSRTAHPTRGQGHRRGWKRIDCAEFRRRKGQG